MPLRTRGEGPIADLVLVKDFGANADGIIGEQPRILFRIHHDRVISEQDYQILEGLLKKKDLRGVYNHLAKDHLKDADWRRALAILDAATGP